jgi:hypothetical protein
MAAEQLLRRAKVPEDLIRRFLGEKDPVTGEKRSKREAGALVLDELARRGGENDVVRRLVAIAAGWDAFHLAQDEYKARAVVQKARNSRASWSKRRLASALKPSVVRKRPLTVEAGRKRRSCVIRAPCC